MMWARIMWNNLASIPLLVVVCGLFAAAPAASSEPAALGSTGPRPVHLSLGRTTSVHTSSRMKRIYVSNSDVVRTYMPTPYEVLITAKAVGVCSLVTWADDGSSKVYNFSVDVDADGLKEALAAALPRQKLTVSAVQDRIEIAGTVPTQADADAALKIAAMYGKSVVNSITVQSPHPTQVQLRVRFLEVDRVKLAQLGVNLYRAGKTTGAISTQQFTSFGSFAEKSTTQTGAAGISLTNPLNLFLYNSQLDLGVTLQDLEQKQVLQILAEPTITSINGEEASFLSGGEFPFPVVQGGGAYTSITVQFRPYGVKLSFTPTVNPDGTIRLKVAPEVSALDYTNQLTVSGYTIPAISTRRAQTDVELRNGQSFAISGLLDRRLTDNLSKMPGIASIPIIGQLFRSKGSTTSQVELVVIVTPTIVDPLTDKSTAQEPTMSRPNIDPQKFDQQVNSKKW